MNISLRMMIIDHRTDTYVPGTNGHTSVGIKTLTTSGAGFPVRYWLSFPSPLCLVGSHGFPGIMLCVWLFAISLLFTCISLIVCVTRLQNINLCILIVRSSPSRFVLKKLHLSRWSWVSCSPVVQCLHSILSLHWDDLFPFIFIWHLYMNHSLASDSFISYNDAEWTIPSLVALKDN